MVNRAGGASALGETARSHDQREPGGIVLKREGGEIRVGDVIAACVDVVDELPEQQPQWGGRDRELPAAAQKN